MAYTNEIAGEGLKSTVSVVEEAIKKDSSSNSLFTQRSRPSMLLFSYLVSSVRASKFNMSTEYLVLDSNRKVIFPESLEGTFVSGKLLSEVNKILPNSNRNELHHLRIELKRYIAVAFQESGLSGAPYLVLSHL